MAGNLVSNSPYNRVNFSHLLAHKYRQMFLSVDVSEVSTIFSHLIYGVSRLSMTAVCLIVLSYILEV